MQKIAFESHVSFGSGSHRQLLGVKTIDQMVELVNALAGLSSVSRWGGVTLENNGFITVASVEVDLPFEVEVGVDAYPGGSTAMESPIRGTIHELRERVENLPVLG